METPQQMTDEEKLTVILKEGGVDDPVFHSLMGTWAMIQNRLADASPGPDHARIEVDLKRAEIYLKGGHIGLALECFESAREYAFQKRMNELDRKISRRIDKIKESFT